MSARARSKKPAFQAFPFTGLPANMLSMAGKTITVNRAPVLTLWATVVAECLGYSDVCLVAVKL